METCVIRPLRSEEFPCAAEDFIRNEAAEMEKLGFCSGVVEDAGGLAGVLDYRPGQEVYLSLLMLRADRQGRGAGARVYRSFGERMRREGARSIRIDVVDDYAGSPLPFWENLGFQQEGRAELVWGEKRSAAAVLRKRIG